MCVEHLRSRPTRIMDRATDHVINFVNPAA
jgi:hypothetical protein